MGCNYNQIILVGRLTKDPEMKEISEDAIKTAFTLAVDRNYKKAAGTVETDFIPVGFWGKQALNAFKLLKKGSPVLVSGKLQIDSFEKNNEKKWITEINGQKFQILESKSKEVTK